MPHQPGCQVRHPRLPGGCQPRVRSSSRRRRTRRAPRGTGRRAGRSRTGPVPSRSLVRSSNSAAVIESPPRSRKLSSAPTRARPSTSRHTCAIVTSVGVSGARKVRYRARQELASMRSTSTAPAPSRGNSSMGTSNSGRSPPAASSTGGRAGRRRWRTGRGRWRWTRSAGSRRRVRKITASTMSGCASRVVDTESSSDDWRTHQTFPSCRPVSATPRRRSDAAPSATARPVRRRSAPRTPRLCRPARRAARVAGRRSGSPPANRPPISKKLSVRPIAPASSTSAQIRAIRSSSGARGGTRLGRHRRAARRARFDDLAGGVAGRSSTRRRTRAARRRGSCAGRVLAQFLTVVLAA